MTPIKLVLTINGKENPQSFTKEELYSFIAQYPCEFDTNGAEIPEGSVFERTYEQEYPEYSTCTYAAQGPVIDDRSELIGAEGSVRLIGHITYSVSFTQFSDNELLNIELDESESFRQVPDLKLIV